MGISRRDFLKNSGSTIGSLSLARLAADFVRQNKKVKTRPFGKTGWRASIYALGTAEMPSGAEAVTTVQALIDAGVNYIDTAPSYRATQSEKTLGEAIQGRRHKVFIASKTLERDADGAYREVTESLKRLKTETIDLLQVHAVNDEATLTTVLKSGGAVEGLEKARKEGLIRHIGITGHTRPEVITKAIQEYPFASILVPVSALDKHINDFAEETIPLANEKGIGIAGMKALKGMERATGGKFDPEDFLRYSLSLPISTLTVGLRHVNEAAANLEMIQEFEPMDKAEMTKLESASQEHANTNTLWWKKQ